MMLEVAAERVGEAIGDSTDEGLGLVGVREVQLELSTAHLGREGEARRPARGSFARITVGRRERKGSGDGGAADEPGAELPHSAAPGNAVAERKPGLHPRAQVELVPGRT